MSDIEDSDADVGGDKVVGSVSDKLLHSIYAGWTTVVEAASKHQPYGASL